MLGLFNVEIYDLKKSERSEKKTCLKSHNDITKHNLFNFLFRIIIRTATPI